MWLRFNCTIFKDISELQIVEYLPPINDSPTSKSVVYQTLELTKNIAESCKQKHIIVTYDLAIAKMALQIQENKSPKFDIFINLEAFHMHIGKYIESCGVVEILVQAKVLAAGSMNSFLDRKHFNRCKRIHPLTSAALEIIHLEQYLGESNVSPEILCQNFENLLNSSNETLYGLNDAMELPDLIDKVLEGYKEYWQETINGKHGKTAQFYLQYCEFINLFLRFSRSIRSNDFELYLDLIYEMSDLFFTFNQPNYASI
ncbi:unnamed protein product [Psylliodes chrysocephalus]|uniref:Uncharacterized protein n=1 Tax=Psylliodes chrysocephalus TaxID=3402493 RepID=A0A9P0G6V9_9CUCU|nr:unnamed protein product [Psylliodes chrysocephala]